MKYVAACMLVHLSGKVPNKENVTAVLEAIGAEVEDKYLNSVLEKLKGQNIEASELFADLIFCTSFQKYSFRARSFSYCLTLLIAALIFSAGYYSARIFFTIERI